MSIGPQTGTLGHNTEKNINEVSLTTAVQSQQNSNKKPSTVDESSHLTSDGEQFIEISLDPSKPFEKDNSKDKKALAEADQNSKLKKVDRTKANEAFDKDLKNRAEKLVLEFEKLGLNPKNEPESEPEVQLSSAPTTQSTWLGTLSKYIPFSSSTTPAPTPDKRTPYQKHTEDMEKATKTLELLHHKVDPKLVAAFRLKDAQLRGELPVLELKEGTEAQEIFNALNKSRVDEARDLRAQGKTAEPKVFAFQQKLNIERSLRDKILRQQDEAHQANSRKFRATR
jgi:hypothetical protein